MFDLPEVFYSTLTKAINYILVQDEHTLHRLQKLGKKTVSVEIINFNIKFYLHLSEKGVVIQPTSEHTPDTTIRGTVTQLFKLSTQSTAASYGQSVDISGDMELGAEIKRILSEIEWNFEAELAKFIGDTPAHLAAQFTQKAKKFAQQNWQQWQQNVSDYFHYERNLLPPKEQIETQYRHIEESRLATERLEARIEVLIEKTGEKLD